jgi:pilus assembly protein CpaE
MALAFCDLSYLAPAGLELRPGDRVVAYIGDSETEKALSAVIAPALGDSFVLHRGNIATAIAACATAKPPKVLIADIGGAANSQALLLELAALCPPDTVVFAVGESSDIGFYRMLTHDLGVAEYLPKPVTRDAVHRLLLPQLTGQPTLRPEPRGGQIVAICGARGGVGTSSIAVGLAYELTAVTKGHVALVDLHVQNGEIALMLGARPGPGLRMALENGDRLDQLFLKRVAIQLEPRLSLIASQGAWDTKIVVEEGAVVRLLELLRTKFNYVVADIPMPTPAEIQPVLSMARQVITVMTPDVASLRDTQNIREYVSDLVGMDRIVTVLNRHNMKGHIDRDLIERTLGAPPDVAIPELGGAMLDAINKGVPAVRAVPMLRQTILPLVRQISGVRTQPEPAGALPWLKSLWGRMAA